MSLITPPPIPIVVRVKKGQEKEQKGKEKAESCLYTMIKVARDEDLGEQIGKEIYFDLVDHDKVRAFRIQKQMPFAQFKEVAKAFGRPVQFQRYWLWARRQNHTYRPDRALTAQEEIQPVGELREVSNKWNNDELKLFLEVELCLDLRPLSPPGKKTKEEILLFFKFYDPLKEKIRYVGRLFVKGSGKPLEILAKLNELAGFSSDEEIELFEEIKFEPNVMCEHIDKNLSFHGSQLEDGDIICFQKSLQKQGNEQYRFPEVPSFLEYVHNRQDSFEMDEDINSDESASQLAEGRDKMGVSGAEKKPLSTDEVLNKPAAAVFETKATVGILKKRNDMEAPDASPISVNSTSFLPSSNPPSPEVVPPSFGSDKSKEPSGDKVPALLFSSSSPLSGLRPESSSSLSNPALGLTGASSELFESNNSQNEGKSNGKLEPLSSGLSPSTLFAAPSSTSSFSNGQLTPSPAISTNTVSSSTSATPGIFGFGASSSVSSANAINANSTVSSSPFAFGASSTSPPTSSTAGIFGSNWQASKSPGFSSPFSSATPTVFGASSSSFAALTTTAVVFGSAPSTPSGPAFPFGSTSLTNSCPQPIFGYSNSPFTAPPRNNNQMNMEDSMAEDTMHASSPAVAFGQPSILPSPGGFAFDSTPSQFQFGGQQNQAAVAQNPPFAASGSFGGGGSFSLGSNDPVKSIRKIIKVIRNKNRRKWSS